MSKLPKAVHDYFVKIGRKGGSQKKNFSPEEIARRTARLLKANRWPKKKPGAA
jgi:hypothetical protein